MGDNTEQSSNASAQGSTLTRGAISIWHWTCRLWSGLWSQAWFLLALLGLAVIVMADIVTFRRRQSKTQVPDQRTRPSPIPIHDRGQIYLINPDGSRTPVTFLFASTMLQAYAGVVGAAMVYEKTKLPD